MNLSHIIGALVVQFLLLAVTNLITSIRTNAAAKERFDALLARVILIEASLGITTNESVFVRKEVYDVAHSALAEKVVQLDTEISLIKKYYLGKT